MAIPTRSDDLTSERLSEALGSAVSVEACDRIGADYGFAGETYRVDLGGFATRSVAVKLWAMRSPSDDRELRFYRELTPTIPIPLPRFFAGDADPIDGRGWMIIEYLDDCRQGDDLISESEASLGRIVETLAVVHGATEGELDGHMWLDASSRARRSSAAIADRHSEYLERFGPLPDGPARELFDALPRLIPESHRVLDASPAALLHRDLGFDNMLFRPPDDQPIILDWQHCEAGPGVRDLASVLFATTTSSLFEAIVSRYEHAVTEAGGSRPAPATLDAALVLEFTTRTLGVVRWVARTERGEAIRHQTIDTNPVTIAAWRSSDPGRFDRLLGA